MSLVKLTIDGVGVEVPPGTPLIDAAKQAGIAIPTLCYLELHKAISGQNASCRMCVVEVAGRRNLAPACVTPVMEGMVVTTDNERIRTSRKVILDLFLSDHPQDCMTCSKAGACTLQDLCYTYEVEKTTYHGVTTEFPLDDSNEFYTRDMSKCVKCRRCVNACSVFQGTEAIDFAGRGFNNRVAVPFDMQMKDSPCVSCGNCVSVCPVGALMPKMKEKYRFWEVKEVKTTCSYCGVGCELKLQVKDGKVVGAMPSDGAANNGILCVKGKFAYNFINHPARLKKPLIRKDGELVEATWDEAYDLVASKIKQTKQEFGPQALGGLSSARTTNEENYLFQKMVRAGFGCNNVDHCARL